MFKFIALLHLSAVYFAALLHAQPSIFPLTGKGDCVKGASYTINSIADLKKNINDLECIFAAGVAPDAIGLGFHYGTVLLGENSVAVQPFAAPFYQGDYVVKTTCNKKPVHFGILKVAGFQVGAAPWTLAPFIGETAPGEAPIDATKNNIVMDFRQDVSDICPVEDAVAKQNILGFLPFRTPPAPVNCFVDLARVVGRDSADGGFILLAKGMNNNPATGWQSSLFYALKNFDPAVKPEFKSNTPVVVPEAFDYIHNGFVDTFSQFGASGGIPFLMSTKKMINSALTSNPFVAALSLARNMGVGYNTSPLTFAEQYYSNEMKRNGPEEAEPEEVIPVSRLQMQAWVPSPPVNPPAVSYLRVEGSTDGVKDSATDYAKAARLLQSLQILQELIESGSAASQ